MTEQEEKPGLSEKKKTSRRGGSGQTGSFFLWGGTLGLAMIVRRVLVSTFVLGLIFSWITDTWQFSRGRRDTEEAQRLADPVFYYLTKNAKGDYSGLKRGDFVMFEMKGVPPFPDGTRFSLFLAGLPGDHVEVTRDERILINGKEAGRGLSRLRLRGQNRPIDDFVFSGRLPEKKYYVLGDTEYSFDSRYWGPIDESQIIGRTRALYSVGDLMEICVMAHSDPEELEKRSWKEKAAMKWYLMLLTKAQKEFFMKNCMSGLKRLLSDGNR